jgi:hypothetical protein
MYYICSPTKYCYLGGYFFDQHTKSSQICEKSPNLATLNAMVLNKKQYPLNMRRVGKWQPAHLSSKMEEITGSFK